MFDNTITLKVKARDVVMTRVNQDNYGSEYRFRGDTDQVTMKIRHSGDSPDKDGIKMERHNVFVEHIVHGTATTLPQKFTSTVTLRNGDKNSPILAADLTNALLVWASPAVVTRLSVGEN